MRQFIKSTFLWQFGGGFALGVIGLVALQPADARHTLVSHIAASSFEHR